MFRVAYSVLRHREDHRRCRARGVRHLMLSGSDDQPLAVESGSPSTESHAGVAELADAQDLKSWAAQAACGFDSRPRHQFTQ
jgi:hypothetical protein